MTPDEAPERTERLEPAPEPASPPVSGPGAAAERTGHAGRGPRWLAWLVGLVVLAVVAGIGARSVGWLPELRNPFAGRSADRSQPVLLRSIQDLSRFVAAQGNFEVVVDLQNNRKYLPDALVNDRTLFVAAGSVEAYVDFGALGGDAITQSPDRRSVTVRLPAPQLGAPNLDHGRSYVFAQQRGLLNRVGDLFDNDPNKLTELYRLAGDKIATAARDSGLAQRAQDNARKTIEGMLHSLGYATVTVQFPAV